MKNRAIWIVAAIAALAAIVTVLKDRALVLERTASAWQARATDRWCEAANAANPHVLIPDPASAAGEGPVTFLAKPGPMARPVPGTLYTSWSGRRTSNLIETGRAGMSPVAWIDDHMACIEAAWKHLPPKHE